MQNYIPALWSFVMYTDVMAGYARTFHRSSSVEELPLQDRFYMGGGALDFGSTQLRGYGFRKVGPRQNDYAIGGSTLFKYSAELRLPVIPSPTMYLLLFAEAGNVFSSLKTSDPFRVKRSLGYGFRLFMPLVGVIGLDIGYGLDKSNKKTGYPKYHIQLGQQF
jgi:outer membrane protein insertion porin family